LFGQAEPSTRHHGAAFYVKQSVLEFLISAKQVGRRCPAFGQQWARWGFGFVLQVLEDLLDHHGIFDAGNDFCGTTTFTTGLDVM